MSRVTVVTAEDIDLGQTLQYSVPGLCLNMTGGQFSYADVSLQGGRPGDVLWLVDGVRVNNRLGSGTMPLDTLPACMIERIEVLEGAQGLFCGTQAISGVINVITNWCADQRFSSGYQNFMWQPSHSWSRRPETSKSCWASFAFDAAISSSIEWVSCVANA